jgi:hypothetical protein
MEKRKRHWTPEISYESDDADNQLGSLPLIHVPNDEEMPRFLMIWEARNTGEFEPGPEGEDLPIVEWDLRQYAQMDVLKNSLTPEEYDRVRAVLGLKPLAEAVQKGHDISSRVRDNVAQAELHSKGKKL